MAGVDDVGEISLSQDFLDGARLGVRPVEDREVAVAGLVALHTVHDGRGHAHRLRLFVPGGQHPYLLSSGSGRAALFRDAPLISGYQGVRCLDYDGGGAVVVLQTEGLALREVLPEVQDVLDARSPERVDGLRVVAHHAEILMELAEFLYYQVLGVVRVLILVHHYVSEPPRYGFRHVGAVAQQDVHIQQDVVVVHHPGLAAFLPVQRVDVADARLAGVSVAREDALAAAVGFGRDEVVLRYGDAGEHLLGLVDFLVETELLHADLYGALRIGSVVNCECGRIAQTIRELAQETYEHRMEGAHTYFPRGGASHHSRDALFHLARRLPGEGERHYLPRGATLIYDVGRSAGQNPCFSGTRAGHDEDRTVNELYRFPLLLTQPL